MVKLEDIDGTPFKLVTIEEKKSFLGIGGMRISPMFDTKEDVLAYIDSNKWDLVINLCIHVYEKTKEYDRIKEVLNKPQTMPEIRDTEN